jgi:integrase
MACLYERKNSPFWYIRFKDAEGKWKSKPTTYRRDNPQDTKEARARCAVNTAQELGARGVSKSEKWDGWIDDFFKTHCKNETTRNGYEQSWLWLRSYLEEVNVPAPSQLTYQHAFDYIKWRTARGGNKKKIKQSTALRDIKVLRLLMSHAVRTGMASGNPCLRMGIARVAPKEKEEFTDEQIAKVYNKLPKREKDWRYIAFRIALETGCRLGETEIEFRYINFEKKTITFIDPKGGKPYTTPLPDSLISMLLKIKKSKATHTLKLHPNASTQFSNFLRKIGLKTHSFHCSRVTFITRLARAGVPLREAMKMVNHSSEMVHKIYSRLNVDDLRPYVNKVQFPQPN